MSQVTHGAGSSPRRWAAARAERSRNAPAQRGFSVGAFALSLIFIILLITAPEKLDDAWLWIEGLPLFAEVIAWIVLLPWVLAYHAWHTSWDLWIRLVALSVLLGGFAMSFWRSDST